MRPARCEGAEEGGLVGFSTAAGETAVGVAGQAELDREGLDEATFGFGGEGAMAPGRELRIESGDDEVGDDSHEGRSGIEEAEVARVGRVDLMACEGGGIATQHVDAGRWFVEGKRVEERGELGWVEFGRDGE